MEGIPNRRERRKLEKKLGLLKKKSKLPFDQWLEVTKRSAEVGKQIHASNVERTLRQQDNDEAEKAARNLTEQNGTVDSKGE
jgi:CRISPR/Cas system CSM-associated protein Csm4 (group 5 of RAMP superfamily)